MSEERQRTPQETERALRYLLILFAVGLVGVVLYAAPAGTGVAMSSIVGVALVLAGAAALAGATFGFLFGIPRTLQGDVPPEATGGSTQAVAYRVNTNLEQVSDWLTKILVGVGLTQLPAIQRGLGALTVAAAPGLGGGSGAQVVAGAVLLYYVILGFLFGYLWTRLVFAGELRAADAAAIGLLASKVEQVARKAEQTDHRIEEIERQAAYDARALSLAQRQLNPVAGLPEVSQEDLDKAIADASGAARVQIFNQAWQNRSDNWREPSTKERMERSIPIFRALIRNDEDGKYHMNHGQLGFALKDMRQPDYADAERELSIAIQLRGDWRLNGWVFYEFNRALCRIALDEEFRRGQPSTPESIERILEDLAVAADVPELRLILLGVDEVVAWLELNHVDQNAMRPGAIAGA